MATRPHQTTMQRSILRIGPRRRFRPPTHQSTQWYPTFTLRSTLRSARHYAPLNTTLRSTLRTVLHHAPLITTHRSTPRTPHRAKRISGNQARDITPGSRPRRAYPAPRPAPRSHARRVSRYSPAGRTRAPPEGRGRGAERRHHGGQPQRPTHHPRGHQRDHAPPISGRHSAARRPAPGPRRRPEPPASRGRGRPARPAAPERGTAASASGRRTSAPRSGRGPSGLRGRSHRQRPAYAPAGGTKVD